MVDRILSLGEKAVYFNGKTLYDKGNSASTVFYIKEGVVQLDADHSSLMAFAKKGSFLGLTEAFSAGIYTSAAFVFTYAEVVAINAENLIRLADKDADVQEFIIRQISHLPHLFTLPFE